MRPSRVGGSSNRCSASIWASSTRKAVGEDAAEDLGPQFLGDGNRVRAGVQDLRVIRDQGLGGAGPQPAPFTGPFLQVANRLLGKRHAAQGQRTIAAQLDVGQGGVDAESDPAPAPLAVPQQDFGGGPADLGSTVPECRGQRLDDERVAGIGQRPNRGRAHRRFGGPPRHRLHGARLRRAATPAGRPAPPAPPPALPVVDW